MKYSFCLIWYALLNIPVAVLAQIEVYVTVHKYTQEYSIININDLEERVYKKLTLHSPKAESEATLVIPYDKFSKIADAEIQFTSSLGLSVKKYKLKDFSDQVLQDGFSLFSDNRMKVFKGAVAEYPITIEYSYTIKHKTILGLGAWYPIPHYHAEVQSATLSLKSQIPNIVAIKELRFNGKKTEHEGTQTWQLDSLSAIKREPFSANDQFPVVLLSPLEIDIDGYKGSLKDWNAYGHWINSLNDHRAILGAEDQLKIKNLVAESPSIKSKIEILYKYLQNNTRYVSVQLGIGGWQPMTASEVSKGGYGDCKALANYMRAMLNCVGIESHYTIIGNGRTEIKYPEFVSFSQMNHAILTVPLPGDTTHLECTSQFYPPGYVGSSNSDRYALMSSPMGGKLIRMPTYDHQVNKRVIKSEINLLANGNASAQMVSTFKGEYYEAYSSFGIKKSKEQNDDLLELHDELDYTIDSFIYSYDFTTIPVFNLKENVSIRKFASISGSRIFIPLVLIQRFETSISDTSRLSGIDIPNALTEIDSLAIEIPPGYVVESMPKSISIQTKFGSTHLAVELKNNKLLIVNEFTLLKNNLDKSAYPELSTLLDAAYKSTRSKIVLKKIIP